MISQIQQGDQGLAIHHSNPARRDLVSAEIVEKGIALQALYGTRQAAEFLKRQMIGMDIVVRVLSRQSERRNCNSHMHADHILSALACGKSKNHNGDPAARGDLPPGWRH